MGYIKGLCKEIDNRCRKSRVKVLIDDRIQNRLDESIKLSRGKLKEDGGVFLKLFENLK
jgi:hypothetical protein